MLTTAFHQLGSLGMVERYDGSFRLTPAGVQWLGSTDDLELFQRLHSRVAYVGELLARLEEGDSRVEDLLAHATAHFHLGWTSRDQVRRRLAWLHVLGLAGDGPDRFHTITDKGRSALASVEVVTADDFTKMLSIEGITTLQPAPPILAVTLTSAHQASRRMSIGYVPKDPLHAFRTLVELSAEGIDRQELTAHLAVELEISESSANSLVQTARTLGLHKYTGRETISPTELGVEWTDNATPLNLVRLMHAHYLAFGEALQHLGSEPISAGDAHRALFPNGTAPHQSRTAGVLRRLVEAGAAAEIGYAKYVITPSGRSLLEELPLVDIDVDATTDPQVPAAGGPTGAEAAQEIAAELIAASTDAGNPTRFEEATARALRALGVRANRIGGPGATDVLVTVESNLQTLDLIVVDAKSAASGQLREDSVILETLKEHAAKHGAGRIAVVGPGFDHAGRLPERARGNGIVLITAVELSDIVLSHQRMPYTPRDILDLLTVGQEGDVVERRSIEEAELNMIGRVLTELKAESEEDAAEPITARDIYRLLRKADAVTEDDINRIIQFLAHPRVGAVALADRGGFTLPADLSTVAIRLRTLAFIVEEVARGDDQAGR